MKIFTIIFLGIIIGATIFCGCCSCCRSSDLNGFTGGQNPTYAEPTEVPAKSIDNSLVGSWGDISTSDTLVDSAGNYVGDAYSGQAYRFNDDGTYLYRIIGTGTLINGLSEDWGSYRVSGDKLYLYNIKENFYPFAGDSHRPTRDHPIQDESYTYHFEDNGDTLVLVEDGISITQRLHRSDQ
jgi:hypothetical protein